MPKVNQYKVGECNPTLTHLTDPRSPMKFKGQEAVDQAWEEGWFGPPWLIQNASLISELDFDTKADMLMAVEGDPRYEGLSLRSNENIPTLEGKIRDFELDNDITGKIG